MTEPLPLDATALAARIEALAPGRRGAIVVGLSGGADSAALVHLIARGPLRERVRAVHCDHGLQPGSSAWAERCAKLCRRLELPFESVMLAIDARSPSGLEAAARSARYAALGARLDADDVLLTAHHADDQAETFLLMALRGSGVAGLAAMPWAQPLGAGLHLRPLLDVPRAALAAHALRHALDPVEDPSNLDVARDRNRIRHLTLPTLRPRWPEAAAALGRAAAWCGEANDLLAVLADQDLARLQAGEDGHRLPVVPLAALGEARARNALRRWLQRLELAAPPATALARVLSEVLPAARDGHAKVEWPGGWIAKHRDHLHAGPPLPALDPVPRAWDGLQPLALPGGDRLALEPSDGGDGAWALDAALLARRLEVRFRVGAEAIQPAGAAHHRPLKKLLAERGVLPWMRERVPLLYVDGALAAVAGICVGAEHARRGAGPSLRLVWRGHPPLH